VSPIKVCSTRNVERQHFTFSNNYEYEYVAVRYSDTFTARFWYIHILQFLRLVLQFMHKKMQSKHRSDADDADLAFPFCMCLLQQKRQKIE